MFVKIYVQMILHMQNDEDCIKILKNCHQALPDNGKENKHPKMYVFQFCNLFSSATTTLLTINGAPFARIR